MSEGEISVGTAYVVHCPDRDGLRIALVTHVDDVGVMVRLRLGSKNGGYARKPRLVRHDDVRRTASAREVAVAMPIDFVPKVSGNRAA